ncbi:C1-like [Macleaya cordata]|uniref:protein-disulfide reductase n=1 Tax=Macleaya cordata TaxID=56857 RepID=A0A200Q199_MACCD|nr:C1-like [Macleaya cordata]
MRSLLTTDERDFLLWREGDQVPVSDLEGKIVGLYFSHNSYRSCHQFLPTLKDIYNKLKERAERFEVVFLCIDDDEDSFKNYLKDMPWLAVPFGDKIIRELATRFELNAIPSLVIIGPDGRTLSSDGSFYIHSHGIDAYPFSQEKLSELDEIEKSRAESQTLESLLVSDELDFVLGKGGIKVPVSELVGKTILFYFSRKICLPCQALTPKLAEVYNAIKAKHPDDFEIIFVSCDNDEKSFEEYYSVMPWLVLPYNDKRETSLRYKLRSPSGLPHLEVVGPEGRTILKEARELVAFHGSNAYPFDENRMKEMELRLEEMAKDWPEKVKHKLHAEHELVRARFGLYFCNGCEELNQGWIYMCDECYFGLHPKCALEEEEEEEEAKEIGMEENEEHGDQGQGTSCDGWVCKGEACYKA